MTRVKFCGLSRYCDVDFANELRAEFAGFVFAHKSRRYILPEYAARLKTRLSPDIQAVGVFVDEKADVIARIAGQDIIDIIQLHGSESDTFIRQVKYLTGKPVIRAFMIHSEQDVIRASQSSADYVLLDSGMGTGQIFNWDMIGDFPREYFLAGGLTPENVAEAVKRLKPYAVDVSSGIETLGFKDEIRMAAFIDAVRGGNS